MSEKPDIVERLRKNTDKYPGFQNLNTEAAAEIERLRNDNQHIAGLGLAADSDFHRVSADNERLRAALDQIATLAATQAGDFPGASKAEQIALAALNPPA